ncbi:MAG: hypothetical protein WEE89_08175 [Gemmatimonadota bacterium]
MSNESKTGSEIRISEADVRRILDRAIQLDTLRTNDTTLAELQRVADEVGITSGSITQAIDEFRLGQVSAPVLLTTPPAEITGWRNRLRRLARPLIIGSVSTVLAFFTAALGAEELALVTYVLSIAGSLGLAIMHRIRRHDAIVASKTGGATPEQQRDARNQGWVFQLDLLALWVPWTLLNGLAEEEIIAFGGLAWIVAAIVGMGIVELVRFKPSAGSNQENSAAAQAAG